MTPPPCAWMCLPRLSGQVSPGWISVGGWEGTPTASEASREVAMRRMGMRRIGKRGRGSKMGDGIGLRAGRFEAEPEESADTAFARALETHGEVLLSGERLGRKGVSDFDRFFGLTAFE